MASNPISQAAAVETCPDCAGKQMKLTAENLKEECREGGKEKAP